MQSSSVATLKASLPLYIHLSEDGGSVEYAIDDMPVATYFVSDPNLDNPLALELAYHRFRLQLESDKEYTDEEWEEIFAIPKRIHLGPRHPEDFE